MENNSFRPDFNNPHQNAVVGAYWDGDLSYAYRQGFMQATLALLAAASTECYIDPQTDESNVVFLDALVYPICFNARHFIELFLKDSIRSVSALEGNVNQVGVMKTHDLAKLWTVFVDVVARDSRLVELGMPLEEVLKDISDVDRTGMAFRYPHDLKKNVLLPSIEHINLGVLGERLKNLFKQAEKFSLCVDFLEQEYAQNTFIGKLSRANIEAIARQLSSYELSAEKLKDVEEKICARFDLSSNEFCEVLILIKQHREFSNLIGIELPIPGLPTDVFTRLASIHDGKASHEVITKGEWLRLEAVMEINRPHYYSEEYDGYLKYISSPDYDGPYDPAHVVRNAYALNQRLLGGLLKLGQKTLQISLSEAIPHLAEPLTRLRLSSEEISTAVSEIFEDLRFGLLNKRTSQEE